MTARQAQATPIRGVGDTPKSRPVPKPAQQTNVPAALGFGVLIAVAGGYVAWTHFVPSNDASLISVEEGSRILGSNTRMRTGVDRGGGRLMASLADDAPERVATVVDDSATIADLRAQIAQLTDALAKRPEEAEKLIAQLAEAKGEVARYKAQLDEVGRQRASDKKIFDERLAAALTELREEHEQVLLKMRADHAAALLIAEDALNLERAKATDERERRAAEEAMRLAEEERLRREERRRAPSVIVDSRGSSDADRPFSGPQLVPDNPTRSLAEGTTFNARLDGTINVSQPGSLAAIVTEDVRSVAGGKILIPRNTRLRGRFRTDQASGSMRVVVVWSELVRPDGRREQVSGMSAAAGRDALVSTIWPNNLVSLARDASVSVFVSTEMTFSEG